MLKLYNYLEKVTKGHNKRKWLYESNPEHVYSEVMDVLDIKDELEGYISLDRAIKACKALQIPVARNFKKIYCHNGENLGIDWKMSPFACYLLIINCNPANENVAKAQLFFAMNQKFEGAK